MLFKKCIVTILHALQIYSKWLIWMLIIKIWLEALLEARLEVGLNNLDAPFYYMHPREKCEIE